ncbi:MAG: ribosome biogenesis GTPase Der [Eubacteriales bacterium]|nr:ribosome biogenesis GTPase Der [Eubacteriales bacterium]
MSKPVFAIVGRPNVGKSTLFNKLIGERRSIVEDTPGVTRDRIYGEGEWCGKGFMLIDTGGIEPRSEDIILKKMRIQTEVAIASADVIFFLCDLQTGLLSDDREIALMLKRSGKPIITVVNKCDSIGSLPAGFYEFYELGIGEDVLAVSSVHGNGTGDLLDLAFSLCPEGSEEERDEDVINVAVIGKPNAGKSSIINRLLGDDRHIVSSIAGTTRDAVDSYLENEYGKFNFIDTAGIRRQSKIEDRVEHFSVLRAKAAVERADVCLVVIDASEGVTEQDEKVAGVAHEAGKACIFLLNKWDLVEKDGKTAREFEKRLYDAISYMTYAPMLLVSAQTGQRLGEQLFKSIVYVDNQAKTRITTGMLNDMENDAEARHQPPSDKGKRLKIYYVTQSGVQPPTFVYFCNNAELFHFSYQRYLENRIRETFGFKGTPIRIVVRERGDKED